MGVLFFHHPIDATIPADLLAMATFWMRSDLGITLNGSNVSGWADQTANHNNAAQSVAIRQPAYQASAGVGGLPWVLIGSLSRHSLPITGLSMAEPQEIFAVINVPSYTNAASSYLWNQINSGSSLKACVFNFSAAPPAVVSASDASGTPAGPLSLSNSPPYDAILECSWDSTAGANITWNNTTSGSAGSDPGTAASTFIIGHQQDTSLANNSYAGAIYEICAFPQSQAGFGSTNRTKITRYFGQRYSITVP